MKGFAPVLLLLSAIVLAQSPPAKQAQAPVGVIRTITVKGNQIYATFDILKALGLNPGDRASQAILEQARQKVLALDVFSTASFRYQFESGTPVQYDVIFTVVEDTQVLPMHFERLGATPAEILAYLKTHIAFYTRTISQPHLRWFSDIAPPCRITWHRVPKSGSRAGNSCDR